MDGCEAVKYPSGDSIKGERGTVLVIGGSAEYTGAPYFTASSSFRSGAELVYIFSQKEAVLSLKTILPEAIVMPIAYHEWVLKRITACALGPGLGRVDSETLATIISIVEYLKGKDIPLVIDGDGLRYYNDAVFKNYRTLFLTPNANEKLKTRWIQRSHCLIEKGRVDTIRLEEETAFVSAPSSVKRSCGQGDILVGMLCAFLSWMPAKRTNAHIMNWAKIACTLVRHASCSACDEKWISLVPTDILNKIPATLREHRSLFE